MTFTASVKPLRNVFACGKLRRWECHRLKYGARIILLRGNADLVGNTVFGRGNQILCRTYDSYHRENTQGHRQISSVAICQLTVDSRAYRFRYFITGATAAASTLLLLFLYLGVENYGIYNVNYRRGGILAYAAGLGNLTIIRRISAALKGADGAFTTKKNNLLFKHGNSLKLLTSSAAKAGFKGYLDKESYGYRVKALIKSYGINSDIGGADAGALCAHRRRMLYNLATEIGENNLYVLEAVSVATGIKDSVGLDTNVL